MNVRSQSIVPNVWCNADADAAAAFYVATFPGATSHVLGTYPREGLLDFQRPLAGHTLSINVDIPGPGGDEFRLELINAQGDDLPNPSISFMLNFDPLMFGEDAVAAREHLDRIWGSLCAGGRVLMPLDSYPFSARYGWVEDRFGVSWQLILTDPSGDPRPFVVPALQFGGPVYGHASEALHTYAEIFTDSHVGTLVLREDGTVLFGEVQLAGQWFVCLDSLAEQDFTFSYGVSLEVFCDDQREIDDVWSQLSAVPDDEVCGWLTDRFGVSWTVVPWDIADLTSAPGGFERLLTMKKIVIADFDAT